MEGTQTKPDVEAPEIERKVRATDFLSKIRQIAKDNACPEREGCEEPVCLYCYSRQEAYVNG